MRKLSKRQKTLLNVLIKIADKNFVKLYSVDQIPNKAFERLESMNDYETFYQDANRYLHDNN